MNVAIIVLNWNDWKNTNECLESIYDSELKNFDVILVDNGSTYTNIKNILNWIKKKLINIQLVYEKKKLNINFLGKKNIFLIKNKSNLGLTKGINNGYKFAINNNYEYLIRVDNDFILEKNCLKKLINTLEKSDVVAVSPKILHASLTETVWWSGFKMTWSYLKFQRTMNLQKKRTYDNKDLSKIIETDSICGCCSAYKVKVLEKSGLGDEDFFYGPEDIELSYRLKKYGKLICNQKSIAYHKIAKSSEIEKRERRIYYSALGMLLLIKKIGTKLDKVFGYSYFVTRYIYYIFFEKDENKLQGYKRALVDFFLKKK